MAARGSGALGQELLARGAERRVRRGWGRVLQQQPGAGAVPGRPRGVAGDHRPDTGDARSALLPAAATRRQPTLAGVTQASLLPHHVHDAEPRVPRDVDGRAVRQRAGAWPRRRGRRRDGGDKRDGRRDRRRAVRRRHGQGGTAFAPRHVLGSAQRDRRPAGAGCRPRAARDTRVRHTVPSQLRVSLPARDDPRVHRQRIVQLHPRAGGRAGHAQAADRHAALRSRPGADGQGTAPVPDRQVPGARCSAGRAVLRHPRAGGPRRTRGGAGSLRDRRDRRIHRRQLRLPRAVQPRAEPARHADRAGLHPQLVGRCAVRHRLQGVRRRLPAVGRR